MMLKAKLEGLVFDDAVFENCSMLEPKHALDQTHGSWSLLWGFAKHRQFPPGSTNSNSVVIRMENLGGHRPPNLPDGFSASPDGLQIATMIGLMGSVVPDGKESARDDPPQTFRMGSQCDCGIMQARRPLAFANHRIGRCWNN